MEGRRDIERVSRTGRMGVRCRRQQGGRLWGMLLLLLLLSAVVIMVHLAGGHLVHAA